MSYTKRGGKLAAAVVVAATLGVTAACGSSDEGSSAEGAGTASGQKIKLVLDTFGGGKNFGYEGLIKQFEAENPHIDVEHRNTERFEDTYLPALLQRLEAGSGAGDVVGIDEGAMGLMAARPHYFLDLATQGLDKRQADYPPAKWGAGINKDGKLFALGTDVGGMALCYRRDLFEKAGLPTDREEVSKLWPTWEDFIEVGKRFQSKVKDAKFVDSANTLFNVILVQEAAKHGNITYFNKDNTLAVETNPAVKTAYDYIVKFHEADLTAKLQNFSDPWATGFRKSQFATLGCPAWMLGVVEGNAGEEHRGKWDVAAVPGGGGNWGGSWLAIPAQTKHPKEAAQLLNFLTSKEGHIAAFKEANTFPSSIPAQQDPAVAEAKNEYFNNAPVGPIFSESVSSLQPVFLGEKHAQVKAEVEKVIQGVDQGSIKPEEGWQQLVDAATKAAG